MFVVYSGYVGPDHVSAQNNPCYTLDTYDTREKVEKAWKEYLEETEEDECISNAIFRVFDCNKELAFKPEEVVSVWDLVDK